MTALAAAVAGGASAAVDLAVGTGLGGHGGNLAVERAALWIC